MPPPWVSVGTYSNGFLAELAAAQLRSQEIEVQVRGNDVGLFGAGFQGWAARGWEVLVLREQAELARDVLGPADAAADGADGDAGEKRDGTPDANEPE